MIKFLQLSIVIVGAFAICATAQAQSSNQQTIPEAVDQGLYRPNSNRDEKLKDAMFGSNGETYQTQINAPADPVGIEGEVVGGTSIGATTAETVKCKANERNTPCQ
jgi:hypothetical protein